MFKVGDKIKVTEDCDYTDFDVGAEGVITQILGGDLPFPYIIKIGEDDTTWPFCEGEFELA